MSNKPAEPRECTVTFAIAGNPLFAERVEMIEKSAFTELQKERDELKLQINRLRIEPEKLRLELRDMDKYRVQRDKLAAELQAAKDEIEKLLKESEVDLHNWERDCKNRDKLTKQYQTCKAALEYYSKCEHYEFCGADGNEPETPSGEPENWECGGSEGHEYQFENGGVARQALADAEALEGET